MGFVSAYIRSRPSYRARLHWKIKVDGSNAKDQIGSGMCEPVRGIHGISKFKKVQKQWVRFYNRISQLIIYRNQRTNGPVNAHLISGHFISTKHQNLFKNGCAKIDLALDYS